MTRNRATFLRWLMPIGLMAMASCRPGPAPVAPPVVESRLVLRISRDGALALGGQAIARKNLTAELARLVHKTRNAPGVVPGSLLIESANDVPVSAIFPLAMECQSAGFVRWAFDLIPDFRDPPRPPRDGSMLPLAVKETVGDLPTEFLTLPILLEADSQGKLCRLRLDEREFPETEALKAEIRSILADPALHFDRVTLRIDEKLHYADLLRVLDMLDELKLFRVNLALVSVEKP